MTEENLVRYCTHCGAKMNMRVKTEYSDDHYDSMTGRFVKGVVMSEIHYWKCPNKAWFFDAHSRYDDAPVDGYQPF